MIVTIDGVAYHKQFSSRENGWELVVAPERYQGLGPAGPTKEVRPTDRVLIHRVESGRVVPEWAFWTLVPPWVESPTRTKGSGEARRLVPPPQTHFNSRRDTLLRSSGWRRLLHENRCVLFLDAFLEWSDDELLAGRSKRVGRYALTEGRTMPVAGIWSTVEIDGRAVSTCSVVTADPNPLLAELPHHRMPAILIGNDLPLWLDPSNREPEACLHATPSEEFDALVVEAGRYSDLVPDPQPTAPVGGAGRNLRSRGRSSAGQLSLPGLDPD